MFDNSFSISVFLPQRSNVYTTENEKKWESLKVVEHFEIDRKHKWQILGIKWYWFLVLINSYVWNIIFTKLKFDFLEHLQKSKLNLKKARIQKRKQFSFRKLYEPHDVHRRRKPGWRFTAGLEFPQFDLS